MLFLALQAAFALQAGARVSQAPQDPTPPPVSPPVSVVASLPPGLTGPPSLPQESPGEPIHGESRVIAGDPAADDSVPLPDPPVVQATPQGDVLIAPASGDPFFLGFAAGRHHPPAGERIDPELAANVRARYEDGRPADETYAFVMFSKRITSERVAALEALGARVLGFHPHYSLKVAVPVGAIESIAYQDFVRWIGVPKRWQRVHPTLEGAFAVRGDAAPIEAWISVYDSDLGPASTSRPAGTLEFNGPDGVQVVADSPEVPRIWTSNGWQMRALAERGVEATEYHEDLRTFRVRLWSGSLESVLALDFVQFVEPKTEEVLDHDESMPMVNLDRTRAAYDGATNSVAVGGQVDSGIYYSHSGISGYYWVTSNFTGESSTLDPCGHGTHVAGTIHGSGAVDASYEGAANGLGWGPNGRYFNVKHFSTGSCISSGTSAATLLGALDNSYTDSNGFVTPKPHVHNHSYGTPATPGGYFGTETDCRAVDASAFVHRQLHVRSAGNYGAGGQSIGEEGSAKNAFTVGNVVDYDDATVGDPGNLWTSSSRGPTADDRWKPNVCAPGRWIYSADAATSAGYTNKSGTSMAAPHVTGLGAQLMDHIPFLRYNAPTTAALIMASAVTKDNAVLNVPSAVSTHHLNEYGTGRIEAWRAHFTGSQLATYYYGWDVGTSGWVEADIPILSGADRLTVCLFYQEVAASAGASAALVNDLDLWIDAPPLSAGGNTGEYFAQQSPRDNTEIRIIDSPITGTWRMKVYVDSSTSITHVGLGVQIHYGDMTPDPTLVVTASDAFVKPLENVDIEAAYTNPQSLASAVFLDSTVTGAVTLSKASTILWGNIPTDLLNNQASGFDVLLGDVLWNQTRRAEWTARWSTQGVKSWSVNARSDNAVDKTVAVQVTVDGTPPVGPSNLASTSHQVNVVDCDTSLAMAWTAATDALSGLDGYIYVLDQSPSTVPSGATNLSAGATSATVPMPVGNPHYFHLRAVDKSGNYGTTQHAGPYTTTAGPAAFCTAKVNSLGCLPAMGFSGTPSATSASPFFLTASNVLNQKTGLLFYSTVGTNSQTPFQGGFLCTGTPVVRTPVQGSGGSASGSDCSGSYSFDFNAQIQSGLDPSLVPGAKVRTQYWSRDPNDPFTTGLTNGVVLHICE